MELRLAKIEDLPQLKSVYQTIIQHMNQQGIQLWDDVYPCEFFEEDIRREHLYVLLDNTIIVSAFALCETNHGEDAIQWANPQQKAYYIDRFGVNVAYARKGLGGSMLQHALRLAKEKGASSLRLFVVDFNTPAIHLYLKEGFQQMEGIYNEVIDDDLVFHEYGFEKQLVNL